ncbi:probable disease resistance protein At5g63020 [Pistacia vera]|uniref:probable disease resistance protein At5g63020 n=1 Tax=Pistacia vera TaxID=55513 RepID=UPI001263AB65|nr:probable disease resistance protein At5g63020 [Pistacia vera]
MAMRGVRYSHDLRGGKDRPAKCGTLSYDGDQDWLADGDKNRPVQHFYGYVPATWRGTAQAASFQRVSARLCSRHGLFPSAALSRDLQRGQAVSLTGYLPQHSAGLKVLWKRYPPELGGNPECPGWFAHVLVGRPFVAVEPVIMDFLGPIMDILPTLCNCTSNCIAIIRHLQENLTSLRQTRDELEDISKDVKSRVELAEQQYRKRTNQVEGWLERVRLKLEKVDNMLQRGEQEIQKKCLGTCCPRNCYSSYKLGKEVIRGTKAVKDLINKGKEFKSFDDVSEKLSPPPVDEIPMDKTVGMDSILDEVWRCIDDHKVRTIGLYGIGGVGKTTLLKKLNNKFIDNRRDFDLMIWVTVSKEVNLVGIQEVIRHKLQIPDETWKKKTDEHSRATEICRSFSGKKFVLLLDDLWERIDLLNMGVPDVSYHQNGSKIVFTTRSEDVCHNMDAAVKKFEVKCLSFEESFELFRQCVTEDVLNSHHQITEFAETVAKECKGLPLALITIGRAMSNRRTPEEWRYAINTLQSHPSEFADMESSVFQVLRFSYDSLRDDKHKNCFLYCSLFPEDHMINKDELIDLWIAEGILHNCGLNDTRDAGEFIIRSLKHACLLEMVGDSDDYVKMHDVLRDMALWLASVKENKIFVFQNQESIKKHGIATWKEAVRISLWGGSVKLFRETPFCPRLLTFLVRQTAVETFPSSCFQSMHAMKVLDLSKNIFLTRLPTMLEMINLQYLNLSDTDIEELPIAANSLTKLRFLLLDGTWKLKAISEGLISSLSSLQVFSRGPTINSNLPFQPFWNTTLLRELECLEEIEEINVILYTVDAVFKFKSSPKLQSRVKKLVIQCEQGEELQSPNTSSSVLSSGRFDNLRDLYISNCLIKDLTCLRYATRLRYVFAENCPLLVEIIANEFSSPLEDSNMFKNLEQLNFRDLPVLKSISRVMHFPSLERIWVVRCPSLTKLPLDVVKENNSRILIVGDKEWWDKLEWENSSSKVSYSSMHQTAPVSGLAAQSCSYNFPHFIEVTLHGPGYTYEATKFEERFALLKCLSDGYVSEEIPGMKNVHFELKYCLKSF